MFKNILFCAAGILVAGQKGKFGLTAQPPMQQQGIAIAGGGIISRQPSTAAAAAFLDFNDAMLLMLDHQTGLFQTVKDVSLPELRANAIALVKVAQLAGVPVLTTASEPDGSNGPLFEELTELNTTFIPRKGEISAWDNADFVSAIEASGKKTLIMAGVWTSVCVAFPALQALLDGYKVYAVFDASGDMSEMSSRITLARLEQAGVIPVTTNVIIAELMRTWNRPDAATWGALLVDIVPNYKAALESFNQAKKVAADMASATIATNGDNGNTMMNGNGNTMNGNSMNGESFNGKSGKAGKRG